MVKKEKNKEVSMVDEEQGCGIEDVIMNLDRQVMSIHLDRFFEHRVSSFLDDLFFEGIVHSKMVSGTEPKEVLKFTYNKLIEWAQNEIKQVDDTSFCAELEEDMKGIKWN